MRLPQDRILHIDTEIVDGKVNVTAEWQGELVRCKDCKWYESDGGALMTCALTDMFVDDNCYCWWGERKGGEDE